MTKIVDWAKEFPIKEKLKKKEVIDSHESYT